MAPTPTTQALTAEPSSTYTPVPRRGYWTKANIAFTIVFGLLVIAIFLALFLFYLHRRAEKKKFENHKSDKAGLLANEDKSSMFSRQRESSVTLYVDHAADAQNNRGSTDAMGLVPLHITPDGEPRDPIGGNNNTGSAGSGVSALSSTSNTNTMSTMLLSPILGPTHPNTDEGDLGIRPSGRPRSTSSASQRARYYESTPTNIEMPPVPKIIRTPSDDEVRR